MFAGHYAPAFALKARFPEIPLWSLFVAVQGVDILFFALVPLGVEELSVDPARAGSLALVLTYMPWSHSLLAAALWAAVVWIGARLAGSSWGPALAAAVASHWLLDLPMHEGDLPLAAGHGPRVGFGLWDYPLAAWGLEVGLIAASVALLGGRARALGGLLIAIQTLQTFVVPLPPSVLALSLLSQVSYLGFALAAAWADPKSQP